jgi:hypothetical protein
MKNSLFEASMEKHNLENYTKEQLIDMASYWSIQARSAYLLGEAIANTCSQKKIDEIFSEHMFLCAKCEEMEKLRDAFRRYYFKKEEFRKLKRCGLTACT